MLLENETAILYGGRRRYRQHGRARVRTGGGPGLFLTGRTRATLDAVAGQITSAGGQTHTAVVDATDPASVEAHLASVVDQEGGVDISFNAFAIPAAQGKELAALPLADYKQPIELGTRTHFTLLKRFPRLSEVGEAAALLASDRASAMTAATANITCGHIAD
jgi:3-oxoacyl-[acyl-carrier protein] reductase